MPPGVPLIDAAALVGPRRSDAIALMVLRSMRLATFTVILLGTAVAIAAHRQDDLIPQSFDSPGELARHLSGPLALLVVGIILRILLAPVAYTLTVLALGAADIRPSQDRRSWRSRFGDQLRVVSAVRGLRWSSAVKDEAVDRLGSTGRTLARVEVGVRVSLAASAVVIVVAALVAA